MIHFLHGDFKSSYVSLLETTEVFLHLRWGQEIFTMTTEATMKRVLSERCLEAASLDVVLWCGAGYVAWL